MKIKLLMAGLLGLVSTSIYAQKGVLKDAQESYDTYSVAIAAAKIPALVVKAEGNLNDAKTSIDKAAANEKTSGLPQTYALKGAIYSALAMRDTVPTTAAPLLATAADAIKKAKELDTKGENKKLIDAASINIAQYNSAMGVREYQAGKYDLAYKAFDAYREALPDDTTAIYYTALAASNAGSKDPAYYQYAIKNYNSLLTTKYSGNAKIYNYLATLYMVNKDTANAIKTINAGVAKYPSNAQLREQDVRVSLQAGKGNEILGDIQSAITNDPKNKTLYYFQGLTYSRIGDASLNKAAKTKDATTKTTLTQTGLDNYAKAADSYKKAIEIDPDYFDANFNLGYALMKPAIDNFNLAANLPSNAPQKDYVALRQKADAQFDLALPSIQKAVALDPKSVDALTNLRNYYRGKYDPAHAADNKVKADDVKKQIDALTAK